MANIVTRGSGNLSPWNGFDDLDRLMDNLFSPFGASVFRSGLQNSTGQPSVFTPRLDIAETEQGLEIKADLPGFETEDVQLDITNNILTLQGEKKQENEESGKTFYRSERSYGHFVRRIALPAEVDGSKADATFKNGVLHITLPKSENSQTKRISIKQA